MSLAKEFDTFRNAVIDPEAGEHQIEDMQAAFYAGAICALGVLIKAIISGDEDKEPAMRRMMEMVVECRAFDARMRADAAISRAGRH